MEYNADITHRENTFDSNVTVPAGLLKVQDLKHTYQTMASFEALLRQVKDTAPTIKKEEDLIFEDQNQQMKTLTLISIVEIAVVLAFGVYQYFRLKTLIETKY
jgi:hypothetical protein